MGPETRHLPHAICFPHRPVVSGRHFFAIHVGPTLIEEARKAAA